MTVEVLKVDHRRHRLNNPLSFLEYVQTVTALVMLLEILYLQGV